MPQHRAIRSCIAAAVLSCCAATAQAQVLLGTVSSMPGDTAVAGASILIYSGSATVARAATSDAEGRFEIELPGAGTYVLLASHPDFPDMPSQMFTAELNNSYHVDVRMPRTVVAIEAIDVNVSIRRLPRTRMESANQRIRENRYFGIGTHMTREEIEQSGRTGMADLVGSIDPFRVRAATMRLENPTEPLVTRLVARKAGQWCPLRTYVDGVHFDGGLDAAGVSADMVGAVEVYADAHPHGGYMDPAGCGVMLVWTHAAEMSPETRVATSNIWHQAGGLAGAAALLAILFVGWF